MFSFFKDEFPLAKSNDKLSISSDAVHIRALIKDLIDEKFSAPLKVYILDSGSCNGCELELQVLFSPIYDLPTFGVEVSYESEEADVLLVTGLITENMYGELQSVYKKLKEPKRIILIGDCPISAAPFKNTFALKDDMENFFSTAFKIPACPPEPLVLLEGLHEFLKRV
ncbi:MAG: Formate hydrogenlyase subunit 7 [uncultured Sulfurovum sp.]|uniref:Formate hydrogenlyase subunit 7 n=1 Tax=uncultured Sulfurovum sp. TaxID=269237 RepID=A0A6S6TY77_9BACT|nr:MAG: Formate hydrogenlyase subunit 7 [uncultured Sulfurovum sp.]